MERKCFEYKCAKCGRTNIFPNGINPMFYGWVEINGNQYCYACEPEPMPIILKPKQYSKSVYLTKEKNNG